VASGSGQDLLEKASMALQPVPLPDAGRFLMEPGKGAKQQAKVPPGRREEPSPKPQIVNLEERIAAKPIPTNQNQHPESGALFHA
jgi:hypothetical protein